MIIKCHHWRGNGRIDCQEIVAHNFNLDEVLVSYAKVVVEIPIANTGTSDLILFKFFGLDINDDVPFIESYPKN